MLGGRRGRRQRLSRSSGRRSAGGVMIARYTHPEMGGIWSDAAPLRDAGCKVEIAAAEAMAEQGIIPGGGGARHPRARRVRRRADRGHRGDHQARHHRLHHGRRRARRPRGAVAALRPDLVGRARHRAGAADAATRAT
ncbi:MAG: hypothetical protein MZV64_04595 [Ignavibacteriales bacterium]|nr:hypothetical protein [Ignavibacteriales bacterium]